MTENFDTLIILVALAYFKQEFDITNKLSEISETDWKILEAWESCQDCSYGDILDSILEKVKKIIVELKGI